MVSGIATRGGAGAFPTSPGRLRRGLLSVALAGGAGLGALAASEPAAVGADDGLTHLLRFMALLKAVMALGAVAAVWWRLSAPARPLRLLGYLAATAAMAAGPGLIWGLAHVGWGALLLHGGLAAALVLLWRDPATATKLGEGVARRRSALADRFEGRGRRGGWDRDPSGVPRGPGAETRGPLRGGSLQRGGGTGKARISPV